MTSVERQAALTDIAFQLNELMLPGESLNFNFPTSNVVDNGGRPKVSAIILTKPAMLTVLTGQIAGG